GPFAVPFVWRYVKSIWKRSMLREDAATFGLVAARIDAGARTNFGTIAVVKSGYDGASKSTPIFRKTTQRFVRKECWRHLTSLARRRPDRYTAAAAEVAVHYVDADLSIDVECPSTTSVYLLHRIFHGGSDDYVVSPTSLRVSRKGKKDGGEAADEASFPSLWIRFPGPLLELLARSRLEMIHRFALRLIQERHPNLCQTASAAQLSAMLDADHPPTVALAGAEIDRRFDAANPDWELIERLLSEERPAAREIGVKLASRCVDHWIQNVERTVAFLTIKDPQSRLLLADVAAAFLADRLAARQRLAVGFLPLLRRPESFEGELEAIAKVAGGELAVELNQIMDAAEILRWIDAGTPAAHLVAGELWAIRVDFDVEPTVVVRLADHNVAAVRRAAHGLLERVDADRSVLSALCDSEWSDTRAVALNRLRREASTVPPSMELLSKLLDSSRRDVQEFAAEWLNQLPADFDRTVISRRLLEHPDSKMYDYALALTDSQAPSGAAALASIERLALSIVYSVQPSRKVKRRLIATLARRGAADAECAAAAARILGEIVRTQCLADVEEATAVVVQLQEMYPEVDWKAAAPIIQIDPPPAVAKGASP
ncbi:MAG: hypothetical protein ACRDD1_11310, partial [Planctomycetia bacterium]